MAKEVLKCAGSELKAVLPFDRQEYKKQFKTEGSKEEFEELYKKAKSRITLTKHLPGEPGDGDDDGEALNMAYEDAGRYVVTHCDVLVAVWDGLASRGRGGTAEIVVFARKTGRKLVIIPPDNPEKITVEKT